jgi:5-formyltetrahydrofolate cyclo-ligase
MQALADQGMRLCLPVIGKPGEALTFRAYRFGDTLIPGQWGIGTPDARKEEVTPDLLLCPLLAFDRGGKRLGYGGGYYDITLKQLREKKSIQAIGLAYAIQEVEEVPAGPFDQKLDAVITEREVILPE